MKWFSLQKKWVNVLLHAVVWLALFSLPFLLRPTDERQTAHPQQIGFLYLYFINCASWISFFYLNAYLLFPRLIYSRQYKRYSLVLLLVFIALFFINWLGFILLLPHLPFKLDGTVFFFGFPSLFFLASSIAFTMFKDRLKSERFAKEKENENLKTELAFLRSQVSPHFMFNVLNNMVALARKKSDVLEPSLIKLSSLLRYMLYETDEEKVLLEREVEYLQSYIDLQMQRFGKKVRTNVQMNEIDKSYFIEPMLLIPFVENAFKHGTGLIENAEINIELNARKNLLQFIVSNDYNSGSHEVKDKTSGIGLQNVRRRLNLLYPQTHALLVNDNGNKYIVSLQLNLH